MRISRNEKLRDRSLRMMMIKDFRDNKVKVRHPLEAPIDPNLRGHLLNRQRDLHSKAKVPKEDLKSPKVHQNLAKTGHHHNKLEIDQNQRKWILMMILLTLRMEDRLPTEGHLQKEKVLLALGFSLHPRLQLFLQTVGLVEEVKVLAKAPL